MTVNIPTKLDDWTFEIIKQFVDNGQIETDTFDFKVELPKPHKLTKICSAFANTKGGFVVVGVGEKDDEYVIEGIENSLNIAHEFGQKLNGSPSIYFNIPKIIEIPKSEWKIAVFEIPLSPERPHIVDTAHDKRVFWKRTHTGCEQMTYEEIRMSFLNYQERRRKINLLYIELVSIRDQINTRSNEFRTLDCSVINSLLSDVYIELHDDNQMINAIFNIRNKIRELNDEIGVLKEYNLNWQSTTGQQRTDQSNSVKYLYGLLLKNLRKVIFLLEKRFDFVSPFEDVV